MSTPQPPTAKHERIFTMPEKFLTVKQYFTEHGTEEQKQLIQLAEDYLAGLNNMFYDREVDQFMLKEFDFPMFVKELEHAGLLQGKSRPEYVMLIMNVQHIVRHTWEFTGADGVKKTGNDLRKAYPILWENDEAFTVEQLIKDIQAM